MPGDIRSSVANRLKKLSPSPNITLGRRIVVAVGLAVLDRPQKIPRAIRKHQAAVATSVTTAQDVGEELLRVR